MKINMDKWKDNLLSSKKRLAFPVLTSLGFDLIGKKIIDSVTNGETQFRAIKTLSDSYPSVACPMMMDLSVEAEAFGAKIKYSQDEIPSVLSPLISQNLKIKDVKIPTINNGRIQEFLKAAKLAAESIKDKPVLPGCIGPFSLAGRLYGMTEIMTEMILEPDEISLLLEKCAEFLLDYINEYKKNGANGILMAEPAAGMLSPEMCDEFSSKYIRNIVEKVQDDYFIFILHNCGNTGILNKSMLGTRAKGLHFGNKNNIVKTLKELPKDVLIFGNLDPANVIKMGTPELIKQETRKLLEETKEFPNFILSSGCDIPPGVTKQNIDAFYSALKEFNK